MTAKAFTIREAISRSTAVTSRRERGLSAVFSNRNTDALRQVPMFIPADQAYYWSSQWQRDEAESLADLRAGRARTFDDPQDAIRHLLSDD
jgi:hypothetical protein